VSDADVVTDRRSSTASRLGLPAAKETAGTPLSGKCPSGTAWRSIGRALAFVLAASFLLGVNIGLGEADQSECPAFDNDGSGTVTVDELLTAVNNGLLGCP
jgi:hypothetical protein